MGLDILPKSFVECKHLGECISIKNAISYTLLFFIKKKKCIKPLSYYYFKKMF